MLSGTGDTTRVVTDKDKDGNSIAFSLPQGQFHGHPATVTGSLSDDMEVVLTAELFRLR